MPPRHIGVRALRELDQEIREAARERKDIDNRIGRLRAAQAALRGQVSTTPKHARRLSTPRIAAYLVEHPGSRSIEIADALQAPPTNVQSLLSAGKRQGRFREQDGRWWPGEHPGENVDAPGAR